MRLLAVKIYFIYWPKKVRMRYVKIWKAFLLISLKESLAYRVNFFLGNLVAFFYQCITVLFFEITYNQVDTVVGWKREEMMLLLGSYMLVMSLDVIFRSSLRRLPDMIHEGRFDSVLAKPISSLFYVSFFKVNLSRIFYILGALGVTIMSWQALEIPVTFQSVGAYSASILLGGFFLYLFSLFSVIWAFHTTRLSNAADLYYSVRSLARAPVDIYPGRLSLFFSLAVPLAVAATLPAESVLGRLTTFDASITNIGVLAWAIMTFSFWRYSIQRYSSASS